MDNETIKKNVYSMWKEAVLDREDNSRMWFSIGIATQWEVEHAKIPYWQIMAKDAVSLWLIVWKK